MTHTTQTPQAPVQMLGPDSLTQVTGSDGRQLVLIDLGNGTFALADTTINTGVGAPPPAPVPVATPTFSAVADEWWDLHVKHLSKATQTDYRWRLERHVKPWFGDKPIGEIKIRNIDEYRSAKLSETQPLSGASVNKMIMMISTVFDFAIEAELVEDNPARGRKRRVKVVRKPRTHLDRAEQIKVLLEAAQQLDEEATDRDSHIERRAMVATLVFAGLRIGELCNLLWGDVDLDAGWLYVRRSKTPAGVRQVRIRGALLEELKGVRERATSPALDAPVFATREGNTPTPHNVRKRVICKSARRAGKLMAARGGLFPEKITPHSLRRTFASLLFAIGEPHPVVMLEMGHTTAEMTLGIYAHAMRREKGEIDRLHRLTEFDDPRTRGVGGALRIARATTEAIRTSGKQRRIIPNG